jgi:hypothetical protein
MLLLLANSCYQKPPLEELNTKSSSYHVTIKDEDVLATIKQFINERSLDSLRSIISLNVKTDTYRKNIYIGSILNQENLFGRSPSYYSITHGYLVFIYTDVEKFLDFDKIVIADEIKKIMASRKILLQSEETLSDVSSLKVSICEDGHITKIREADELEIPCFYKLAAENGKLVLEEQDWFKEKKRILMQK